MLDTGGYRGSSLELLRRSGVTVGDEVEVRLGKESVRGTVVPRYQYNDDAHVVLKLDSGYNVGIGVARVTEMKKLAAGARPSFSSSAPRPSGDLPEVAILGTGGTIASRVDYRTGAVHPAISAEDLYSLIPELSEIARIRPEIVLTVYSENLEPGDWSTIAKKVSERVSEGVRGVLVTTGTDTMGYTAAALSFALKGVGVPVLVVGSQRSSDRPSSDAYLNLMGAVSMAVGPDFSGVYVVMHADESDDRLAVHMGTRVRKNHTSSRDAFRSVGVAPVAFWTRDGFQPNSVSLPRRGTGKVEHKFSFDPAVSLLTFYPSMSAAILKAATSASMKGLVIEGSGLGHINRRNIPVIADFVASGGIACMTSQCVWGRVDMNVYDTGRDLISAGVIPLEDMLGETALVKLMWALGNSSSREDAISLMKADLVGETTGRSLPSGGP